MNIPQEVRVYIEGILQDANMQTADDGMKEEMIKELFARLDSYLTSVIVENMPHEHLEAFIKLNEDNKPKEEVEAFVKEKMPNAQEVFAKAFADFRDMYLKDVTISRNRLEPQNKTN